MIDIARTGAFDIEYTDGIFTERLEFNTTSSLVKVGSHVRHEIISTGGKKIFNGIITRCRRNLSISNVKNFTAFSYPYLHTKVIGKKIPDHDPADISGNTIKPSYLMRFKGDGIGGTLSIDQIIEKIEVAISDGCARLTGIFPQIDTPGLYKKTGVMWLAGVNFNSFFRREVEKRYPTMRYKFVGNKIVLFDHLLSPVHDISIKDCTDSSSLNIDLERHASQVIVESKSVDFVEGTVSIDTDTEFITMPPYFTADIHGSELTEGEVATISKKQINKDHDAWEFDCTVAGEVDVYGGQDKRMEVSVKGGNVKDKFGWDFDAVYIEDDFGRIQGAGSKNVDYESDMREVAEKTLRDIGEAVYSGDVTLTYHATQISPGDRIRIYDDTEFYNTELYVSEINYLDDGNTKLTIDDPGQDFFAELKAENELRKMQAAFESRKQSLHAK